MLYALPNTRGLSHCLLSYERRVGESFFCVQIVDHPVLSSDFITLFNFLSKQWNREMIEHEHDDL